MFNLFIAVGAFATPMKIVFTGTDPYEDANVRVVFETNDATTPTAFKGDTSDPSGVSCYALRSGGAIGSTMTITFKNPRAKAVKMYAGAKNNSKAIVALPAHGKLTRDNTGTNVAVEDQSNTLVFENRSTGTYAIEYIIVDDGVPYEAVESKYTIKMKTGSTTANASSVTLDAAIDEGAEYLDGNITGSLITPAATNGMRLGNSSTLGYATMKMSQLGKVEITRIVFHTVKYGSDTGTYQIKLNSNSGLVASNKTPGVDYEYVPTTPTVLTSIFLQTSAKRMDIASIDVYYNEYEAKSKAVIYPDQAAGEYPHLTLLDFTVHNAKELSWKVTGITSGKTYENISEANDEDDHYAFKLNEDTKVEIYAVDEDGMEATFEGTYTVKRPGNLSFFLTNGDEETPVEAVAKVAPESNIKVKSEAEAATKWHVEATYFDLENNEQTLSTDYPLSLDCNIAVQNGAKGTVTSTIDNGLEGYTSTQEFDFTVEVPAAPVPDIPSGSEVTEGTVLHLTLDPTTKPEWTYVWVYNLDGSKREPYFLYNAEQGIVIDKNNFRFEAKSKNQKGWSELAEMEYVVVEKLGQEAQDKWVLVTSNDEIKTDGTEYVIAYSGKVTYQNMELNWVMGKQNTNNLAAIDATIVGNEITKLPTDATIITFEATTNTTYPYTIKVGNNFLYNNTTSNYLKQYTSSAAVGYCSINIDGTTSDATIKFNKLSSNKNYMLQCYYTGGSSAKPSGQLFSTYTTTQHLPQLYRHVIIDPVPSEPVEYDVTFHHTEYIADGTPKPILIFETGKKHNKHIPLSYLYTDEDGTQIYRGTVENLCGHVILEVEGTDYSGHKQHATTDFHSAKKSIAIDDNGGVSGCDKEHAPYVYLENMKRVDLAAHGSENVVPMTTNPNEYHQGLIHHASSTVTVGIQPGSNINIKLESAEDDLTGVSDIVADSADGAEAWYNLQGVRVANPERGNIYIHVTGSKAVKELVK